MASTGHMRGSHGDVQQPPSRPGQEGHGGTGASGAAATPREEQRRSFVNAVNWLLQQASLRQTTPIHDLKQCTSSLFVLLFQRIFGTQLHNIELEPNTTEKKLVNIRSVLSELEKILGRSLSYISPYEIVLLNEDHICRLIDVFVALKNALDGAAESPRPNTNTTDEDEGSSCDSALKTQELVDDWRKELVPPDDHNGAAAGGAAAAQHKNLKINLDFVRRMKELQQQQQFEEQQQQYEHQQQQLEEQQQHQHRPVRYGEPGYERQTRQQRYLDEDDDELGYRYGYIGEKAAKKSQRKQQRPVQQRRRQHRVEIDANVVNRLRGQMDSLDDACNRLAQDPEAIDEAAMRSISRGGVKYPRALVRDQSISRDKKIEQLRAKRFIEHLNRRMTSVAMAETHAQEMKMRQKLESELAQQRRDYIDMCKYAKDQDQRYRDAYDSIFESYHNEMAVNASLTKEKMTTLQQLYNRHYRENKRIVNETARANRQRMETAFEAYVNALCSWRQSGMFV